MAAPAATSADAIKNRDQQKATDWQDAEPEKTNPATIPVDAKGPPVVAPHAQVYGSRAALPAQEYVAGQPFPFLSNYLKALPRYVDDLTRDFGSDLYERMMFDPAVYSSVTLLKLSVLADGHQTTPALDDKEDPDYELAEEISEFCERCVSNLQFGTETFEQFCWELLAGLELGHKVAEQVYENGQGDDKGKLVLRALKIKPREATGFVVDAYMNVVGLLGLIPGQGFPVLVGSIVANPSVLPNLLPREKFVVFSYNMKNADIRGTSICRQVYTPWWFKQQGLPEYIRYLSIYASPSYIGTTPENAVTIAPTDSLGNPTGTPTGGSSVNYATGQAVQTPEQQMANSLAQLRNCSAAAFPWGSTVTIAQSQGNGEAFKMFFEWCDGQITTGILFAKLATMEGEHQARASSETHKDIMDMPIAHVKDLLASTIRRDVYYNLVRYNYGDDVARRLTPKITFGGTEENDWHVDADSIAKLVTSKFLSPSQFAALDERLGLPARTDESLAEQEAKGKIEQANIAADAKVAGSGGKPEGEKGKSPASTKPESKNKENSPKDNNQTPKGGKRQPGDSTPFSDDVKRYVDERIDAFRRRHIEDRMLLDFDKSLDDDKETLGFNVEEIRERYKMDDQELARAKVLWRSLNRAKKFMGKRRGAVNGR